MLSFCLVLDVIRQRHAVCGKTTRTGGKIKDYLQEIYVGRTKVVTVSIRLAALGICGASN
jgi:hypothetical protein